MSCAPVATAIAALAGVNATPSGASTDAAIAIMAIAIMATAIMATGIVHAFGRALSSGPELFFTGPPFGSSSVNFQPKLIHYVCSLKQSNRTCHLRRDGPSPAIAAFFLGGRAGHHDQMSTTSLAAASRSSSALVGGLLSKLTHIAALKALMNAGIIS